jgi:hypothetical protein
MNEKQRAMLLNLISKWAGIANDSFATARMEEVKAGLDDTWFAWSGPTTIAPGKNGTSCIEIHFPIPQGVECPAEGSFPIGSRP